MNSISIDDIELPTIEGVIDNCLMSLLSFLRPLYYLLDFLGHGVNHSSHRLASYLGWIDPQ